MDMTGINFNCLFITIQSLLVFFLQNIYITKILIAAKMLGINGKSFTKIFSCFFRISFIQDGPRIAEAARRAGVVLSALLQASETVGT